MDPVSPSPDPAKTPDPELVARLQEELPWIRELVRRRMGPELRARDETEDCVQEAVLDFLRYGPRLEVRDRRKFRALVARVVENNLRDRQAWFRARRRAADKVKSLPSETVLDPETATSPGSAVALDEQRLWVRLALEFLEAGDRALILEHDWEGRSFVEMADDRRMTPNATRMQWVRAVGRLARQMLELRRGFGGVAPPT